MEALACGTPVVVTDIPVLREVLGDRATFVAVGDLEGLLAAAAAVRTPGARAAGLDLGRCGAGDVAGLLRRQRELVRAVEPARAPA